MKIKKVEWRNFASYGNRNQEISFDEEPALIQLVGGNGFGKSSISQVITFGLYGKLEGKKLKDIPNRINGNAWVRITLDSYGNEIIVERGLEPNVFKLFVNGNEYDQAGVRSVQEYLTEDILGIPFYVFNNTISLSVNDFKSFVKMSSQDKRSIIDKIFGFQILNQMRDVIRDENKKLRDGIENINGKINSLEVSINKSMAEMESLTSQIKEEAENKISTLNESLGKFKELQKIHGAKILEFSGEEEKFKKEVAASNQLLIVSKTKRSEVLKKIKLYEHDTCPTCLSSLDSEFHHSVKEGLNCESSSLDQQISEMESQMQELFSRENEISKIKKDLLEKGKKIETNINQITWDLDKLSGDKSDLQINSLERIIEELKSDKEQASGDMIKTQEKSSWLKLIDEILGERGVKQMAIRTILPSLNSEIFELLSDMHLDYQVVFDEEFNATIYHMGMEIPPQTLSTGEMKKVDFVVLVSIMKLMKMKFSNINLLFLDELFSSVDSDGIYSILKILKKASKDLGLNVFVINHAPMPQEVFDWKMEVNKNNNFSNISIEKA
jgi:DNA repair exonuclease SbcCD ATPase subunit